MWFSLFLIFSIIYFLIIRYRAKRSRLYKLMEQFDGPPSVPILGNALDFKPDTKETCKYLRENYVNKFNNAFKVWLLHVPFVVVFKPEDIQMLSTKNLEKDGTYQYLAELIGDGLITCSISKWRRRIRIISSAFHTPYLNNNVLPIFHDHFQILAESLEKKCNAQTEFDIWPYLMSAAFGVICESSMGCKNRTDSSTMKTSAENFYRASVMVAKRIYQPWLYPRFLYSFHKIFTGRQDLIKEAQSLPIQFLEQRKIGFYPQTRISQGVKIKDLIDMIGEASGDSQYLNDQEITDEILTIIFAGTETTAITNAFNLLMLAIKPDVQAKCYNELEEIFGDSDRMPTAEDLGKMTYLEQCFKETLRWVSMVPLLHRSSEEEIELSDGRIIPTGAKIVIAPYLTHRDPSIYPDPDTWNPENFSSEKMRLRHPCAYIPFGFGTRKCLGIKYSMMSMKVLHATILRKYRLRTSMEEENIEMDFDFILRSADGYLLRLERRKSKRFES